jgi:hypothetical protein
MNPNNTSTPGFELPTPVTGNDAATPEQAPMPETSNAPADPIPAAQPQPLPAPVQQHSPMPPMNVPMNPAASNATMIADDADLIEKEWVEKAKAIVASTRHDPRTQNRELNKFKADYMQKRYNKTIKVDES